MFGGKAIFHPLIIYYFFYSFRFLHSIHVPSTFSVLFSCYHIIMTFTRFFFPSYDTDSFHSCFGFPSYDIDSFHRTLAFHHMILTHFTRVLAFHHMILTHFTRVLDFHHMILTHFIVFWISIIWYWLISSCFGFLSYDIDSTPYFSSVSEGFSTTIQGRF